MQLHISTDRLLLRPFQPTDAARVALLAGDKRVSGMTKNIPHPYSESMAVKWISTHQAKFESGESVVYAITQVDKNEVIGAVSFVTIEDGIGTLGYWLGYDYWGKGIMSEAVRGLVELYRREFNLKGLEATHFVENERSRAVIKKMGLVYLEDRIIEIRTQQRAVSVHQCKF